MSDTDGQQVLVMGIAISGDTATADFHGDHVPLHAEDDGDEQCRPLVGKLELKHV
jgi:hypothetical protein